MHWFLTCPHYSLSSFLPLQSSPAKPLIICPCPHSCPCFVSPVGPLHPLALISALVSCHLPVLFTHVRCPNFRPCVVTPPGPLHPLSVALISALVSLHLFVLFILFPLPWFPPLCRYTSWSSSFPVRWPDFRPCVVTPPGPLRPLSVALISTLVTFTSWSSSSPVRCPDFHPCDFHLLVLFVPCPFPWFPPLRRFTWSSSSPVPSPDFRPWRFTWSSSSPVPCPDFRSFVVSPPGPLHPLSLAQIPSLLSFPAKTFSFPVVIPPLYRFLAWYLRSLYLFPPLHRFPPRFLGSLPSLPAFV